MIKAKHYLMYCLVAVGFVVVVLGLAVFERVGELRVCFLDIGQGDAIYIETPSGNDVLIDGGPDKSVIQKLGEHMPFYDRTLELVVLTHPDADHLAGLVEVMERYRVEKVVTTGFGADTKLYRMWTEVLDGSGAEMIVARAGKEIVLDESLRFEVVFPFEDGEVLAGNYGSVVGRLVYGASEFLLTGDIEEEGERRLIEENQYVMADLLKVAHHGSKTSSGLDFLKAVGSAKGVISVGDGNRFGHPDPQILENLEKVEVEVLRTDLEGDIIVGSDGTQLLFK